MKIIMDRISILPEVTDGRIIWNGVEGLVWIVRGTASIDDWLGWIDTVFELKNRIKCPYFSRIVMVISLVLDQTVPTEPIKTTYLFEVKDLQDFPQSQLQANKYHLRQLKICIFATNARWNGGRLLHVYWYGKSRIFHNFVMPLVAYTFSKLGLCG